MLPLRYMPLLILLACPLISHAEWTGQGELGLVVARGNTNTDTGNLKLDLTATRDHWKHTITGRLLYGRNNDISTAQRWETQWQGERKLDDHPFVFASLRYDQDRFGGFAYQGTASLGVGYNFIDTSAVTLSTSVGAGYRRLQPQQLVRNAGNAVVDRLLGETTTDAVSKGGVNYRHQLTETTTLSNHLLVESGARNTLTQDELALQVDMTEKLALALGYSLRHNAEPRDGQQQTDQLTTVNVVYKLQ